MADLITSRRSKIESQVLKIEPGDNKATNDVKPTDGTFKKNSEDLDYKEGVKKTYEPDIKLKQSPIRVPRPLLSNNVIDAEPLGDSVTYRRAIEVRQDVDAMRLDAAPLQSATEREVDMELSESLPTLPFSHSTSTTQRQATLITPSETPPLAATIKFEPIDIVDLTEKPQRPVKPQHIFMDAVVVPTLALIRHRHQQQAGKSINDIYEKIEKLKNPKVKKNQNLVLDRDTIRERLRPVGYDLYPVPLAKHIQDVTVTRRFMSYTYGGNPQETFPKISKENLAKHGKKDFMYMSLSFNPHAPEVPGAPGLWFEPGCLEPDPAWPKIARVFVRLTGGAWLYVGQYKLTHVPSLTKQEWAVQTDKVRNTWTKEICTRGWGWEICARVSFRLRLGREPTAEEMRDVSANKSQYHHATQEQVSDAFARGEEAVAVWTMQCVDYDVQFQCKLADEFPRFVPPPPTTTKKGTANKSKLSSNSSKAKKPRKTNTKKRKRPINDSSSEEDVGSYTRDEEIEEVAAVEEEAAIYRLSGTRSRPIRL